MKSKSLLAFVAVAALCLLPSFARAQSGTAGTDAGSLDGGSSTQAPDTDFSSPITLELHPSPRQFDIRDVQVSAEVDKVTLEESMKAGKVPISITVTNHGKDEVAFANTVVLGNGINIYAEDESFHKKLIFPASSTKVSGDKILPSNVAGGQSITVLLQVPLPASLLNPKYKGYLACVHVYVPRLGHTFEVFSDSFAIPQGK